MLIRNRHILSPIHLTLRPFSKMLPFLNCKESLSSLKLKYTYFSLWNIDPPSFRIDRH